MPYANTVTKIFIPYPINNDSTHGYLYWSSATIWAIENGTLALPPTICVSNKEIIIILYPSERLQSERLQRKKDIGKIILSI
jgi:hypothetical protein